MVCHLTNNPDISSHGVRSGSAPHVGGDGGLSESHLAESYRQTGAVLSSRERGAASAPQLDRPARRATHPQEEVEVRRGVHGIEDVCVVGNHQF